MEEEMAEMTDRIFFGPYAMQTALGNGEETVSAIAAYSTGLKFNERYGMIVGEIPGKASIDGYTELESLMISQIGSVLEASGLELSDGSVRLVVSTTKGNVGLLEGNTDNVPGDAFLYRSAAKVAAHFNASSEPTVISNACISGVSAFVVARRMILTGECAHVVVVGCDMLNEFITSGFASFKSISGACCRPYDASRNGLNLGEASAAVLLTSDRTKATLPYIRLEGGSVTNDANHISGPSRTGDGLYYAIRNAMDEAGLVPDDIGFVNAHGTATVYNDEMESKALALAGLSDRPLNSMKGYIGHTLGASGVVETLICVSELRNGTVYGTMGFSETGVPCPVNVSSEHRPLGLLRCVKTASGFGGCNAAVVLAADLCKGVYVAVEYLMRQSHLAERYGSTEIAVILANSSASLDTDLEHQRILERRLPEGTSPAVFVYTLPSVAAGEVCIRNRFQGDNTFFVGEDASVADAYARLLIERGYAKAAVCGWCDKLGEDCKVEMKVMEIKYI